MTRTHAPSQRSASQAPAAPAAPAAPDAVAKAKLTMLLLREASQRRVRPTAFALFAVLLAESWWSPEDRAWSVRMTRRRLATRLNVENVVTVDRARDELVAAGLISHEPGGHANACGADFAAPSRFTIKIPTERTTTPAVQLQAPAEDVASVGGSALPPSTLPRNARPSGTPGGGRRRDRACTNDAPLLWSDPAFEPDMSATPSDGRAGADHAHEQDPSTSAPPVVGPLAGQQGRGQVSRSARKGGGSSAEEVAGPGVLNVAGPSFGFQQGCAGATGGVALAQRGGCAGATPFNVFQSQDKTPPPPRTAPPAPHGGNARPLPPPPETNPDRRGGGGGELGGRGNAGEACDAAGVTPASQQRHAGVTDPVASAMLLAAGVLSAKVRAELASVPTPVIRHAIAMHANAPPDKRVGRVVLAIRDGTAAAALGEILARRAAVQARPPPATTPPDSHPPQAIATPAQKRAIRERILAAESETRP